MVAWGDIGTCPGPHTGMFCHVDRFVNRVRHWGFGNAMRGSARRMMALVAARDVKLKVKLVKCQWRVNGRSGAL